jgi:hypothetical protein
LDKEKKPWTGMRSTASRSNLTGGTDMSSLHCNNQTCPHVQYVQKARELFEQIDSLSNVLWKLFSDDFVALEEIQEYRSPPQEYESDLPR